MTAPLVGDRFTLRTMSTLLQAELPRFFTADYTVLITDDQMNVVGDPIDCWKSLDCSLRWNQPGSGIVTAVAEEYVQDQYGDGNRVVVIRRPDPWSDESVAKILIAGPIEDWKHEVADNGENANPGVVTIQFADDLARVVAHGALPNPTLPVNAQTADYWTYTGNAELALRALVDQNCGPGATAQRRRGLEPLVLGATAGVGSDVVVSADRMQPLGDLMRDIALKGGGIGFRTRQVDRTIEFQVYAPHDRTGRARFGFALDNLKYLMYEKSAPTTTLAVVGGQGTGADRYMIARVNDAALETWGCYETLVSRAGSTAVAELNDAGDKQLGDGAPTTRLTSSVVDSDNCRYGVDYDVGDIAAVELTQNKDYRGVVKTVHLQAWPTAGELIVATVGDQDARINPVWAKRLAQVEARLDKQARIAVTVPKG